MADKFILRPLLKSDLEFIIKLRNYGKAVEKTALPLIPFKESDFDLLLPSDFESSTVNFIIENNNKPVGVVLAMVNYFDRKAEITVLCTFNDESEYTVYLYKILGLIKNYFLNDLNITKLSLRAPGDNTRLMDSLKKSGFISEVIQREELFRKGKYIDVVIYSLIGENRKE